MDAVFGTRHGTWDGSIAGLEHSRDGGGDALFIANDGEGIDYSPVAFSARLPGGIHLLQFPRVNARHWRHLTQIGGRKPWTVGFFTRGSWTASLR